MISNFVCQNFALVTVKRNQQKYFAQFYSAALKLRYLKQLKKEKFRLFSYVDDDIMILKRYSAWSIIVVGTCSNRRSGGDGKVMDCFSILMSVFDVSSTFREDLGFHYNKIKPGA